MLSREDIRRKREANKQLFIRLIKIAAFFFAIFTLLFIYVCLADLPSISGNRDTLIITVVTLWCASSAVLMILLFRGLNSAGLHCPVCRETIPGDQWNRMLTTNKCPNCQEIVMR